MISVNGKPITPDIAVETAGTDAYFESGSATTTDGTVTTVWEKDLPDGFVGALDIILVGHREGATAGRAMYRRSVIAYRAGSSAAVGSPDTLGTDVETTAGYDITVNATGTKVRVRATGASSHTIRWTCGVRIVAVG